MSIHLPPATDPPGALGLPEAEVHGVSLWRGAFHRVRRNPSAIAGAFIVLAFVVVAVAAPLLTSYQPGSAEWSGQVTPSSVPGPSPPVAVPLKAGSSACDMMKRPISVRTTASRPTKR